MWFSQQAFWFSKVDFASLRDKQGRILARCWGCTPYQPFSAMLWIKFCHNFELFITICLSRFNQAESKLCEIVQNALYLVKTLKIRGQNYKQSLSENCSESTKMAIAVCKFSKNFRGSMPPYPHKSFLLLNLLKICLKKEKNYA